MIGAAISQEVSPRRELRTARSNQTGPMPLTFFAHQLPVVGMKLARRRWFDATALCVGSMMPDLMYSFSAYVGIDTHRWPPAFTYGVPIALLVAVLTRRVLAPVVPRQLPDCGEFRVHSYAVLATRRPALYITFVSVTVGIGSHVGLDWFTHPGRPGVRLLGYDNVDVTLFGVTEPLAGVFQLVGHSFGSLATVALLWWIGRRRLLDEWYGTGAVAEVRHGSPTRSERIVFWIASASGFAAGVIWGWPGERVELIQRTAVSSFVGLVIASVLIQQFRIRENTLRDAVLEQVPS